MEQRDIELFAGIVTKAIEPIKEKIDSLDEKFDGLEQRFDGLEQRFDGLEQRFDGLEQRFDGLEQRFDGLEQRFDGLDLEVRDIKLSLENEINSKISIIAEGHSILNRKLDKIVSYVLEVQDEREKLKLRLVYLESEIIKVKERLADLTPTA